MSQNDILNRGNCFKLLAACFYEPDKKLFIEEQVCENLKTLLGTWAADAAKAAGNMGLSLENCTQDQLSVDHAALFIGPFELIAAPYGSVYTEKHRQVMGDSTIEVLKFYEEVGLSVDTKEPPDHIAIELEFMHHLCVKEAEAEARSDHTEIAKFRELQATFFIAFLQWVPQFCDSIKKGTANPFYADLGDCLKKLMVTCQQVYEFDRETAA
jgi:putative dimethyl sulfoxide reductase chaperone